MPNPVQIVYFLVDNDPTLPNWYIQDLNTGQQFQFVGQNATEQQQSVVELCSSLQENDVEYLAQSIGEDIILTGDMDGMTAVQILFGNTNCMLFQAQAVYPAVGEVDTSLIEYLEPTGDALEDVLELLGWIVVA